MPASNIELIFDDEIPNGLDLILIITDLLMKMSLNFFQTENKSIIIPAKLYANRILIV